MEILHKDLYYSFERLSPVNEKTPILILPPFAGRGGSVTDNLAAMCVAEGRTVYRYELDSATSETADLSLSGLLDIIRNCHNIISEAHKSRNLDLLGTCQGGWLAAIYTSLYPREVQKLALFAAPINTKTGCKNAIETYCATMDIEKHKQIVKMNGGIQMGSAQWLSFAMLAPQYVFFDRYIEMTKHILNNDQKAIATWRKVQAWYDSTRNLAGPWFLDALENHFKDNKLYEGTWVVDSSPIDLSKITCPVLVMAGEDDIITSTEQARGILDLVSSEKKTFILLPGAGHTRVFTGTKELKIFWDNFK